VQPRIRSLVEGFLRGRYGLAELEDQALRVLALAVLIGAMGVAGWLLIGPLLTLPRFTPEGPVVRNGVAAVMVCGKKRGTGQFGFKGLEAATKYAPEPRTGGWSDDEKGDCTIWYHHPPGLEQRHNCQERARCERENSVEECASGGPPPGAAPLRESPPDFQKLPVIERLPED
jgi:hypothetical protein